MNTVILIFSGLLFSFISGLILTLIKFLALKAMYIDAKTRRDSQDNIFDWAYKIVCTIEEEYRNSDIEKKVKSQRKFDQAISRLNDVLMINGVDPKFYNTNGIVTYSIFLLHKESQKKGVT